MLSIGENTPVYLACGATDMRKSINGLCSIVENSFNLDPFDKACFVFCNSQKNRMKILTWSDNGFWLHFKRLERGRFRWPEPGYEDTMILSAEELSLLVKGPGIEQKIKRKEVGKYR